MEFKTKASLLKMANKIIKRYREGYSIRHNYFRPCNASLSVINGEYVIGLF